ncbi:MAG: class I SAM-dependent RNA methyltransferase [Flavobacteriales bacterium]|nr:class I SAM-dependent RNA methyltransferase [Flavobacteriales bacterium]
MDFIAKTMHGLEGLLVDELRSIGAQDVQPLRRAVGFTGDLATLYRANYTCRTAIRILKKSYEFKAKDEAELYDKVKKIAWEQHLDVDDTFSIDPIVNSELFKHSKYASLKMKDAIVDRFRVKMGRRPSVDTDDPDLLINLHIREDKVTVSIDSSGESLHRRGYRSSVHGAPLNEVLAAGMIKLSGWTKESPLLDPMCGSGTIPIEAAMIASNTPPGMLRKHYAFMKWKDFDPEVWKKVKQEVDERIDTQGIRIKASDISGIHVRLARTAAEAMGLGDCIEFQKEDFFELDADEGFLIMNPPYGERMDHQDIETFYEELADHLKRNFAGTQCWLISSNNEALLRFGLKPSKRIVLFNGPLQCLFQQFELYKGSKKGKYQEGHIDRAIRDHGERSDRRPKREDSHRSDRERGPRPHREGRKTDDRKPSQSRKSGKLKWTREEGGRSSSRFKGDGDRSSDKGKFRSDKEPKKGPGFKKGGPGKKDADQ